MANYTISTTARRDVALVRAAQEAGATPTQAVQVIVNRALDDIIPQHEKVDADDIWQLAKTATGAARQTAIAALVASVAAPVVTPPGNQTHPVGSPVELTIVATDPADNMQLTYKATNLPPGMTMNAQGGGLIAGTPTTAGVYNVTVRVTKLFQVWTDISFTWTITP